MVIKRGDKTKRSSNCSRPRAGMCAGGWTDCAIRSQAQQSERGRCAFAVRSACRSCASAAAAGVDDLCCSVAFCSGFWCSVVGCSVDGAGDRAEKLDVDAAVAKANEVGGCKAFALNAKPRTEEAAVLLLFVVVAAADDVLSVVSPEE